MSLATPVPTASRAAGADEPVAALLAAIRAQDADGIASAFDQLGTLQGPAAAVTIATAVEPDGLAKPMLDALRRRAQTLQTAAAWIQFASAAAVTGDDALSIDAAATAQQLDPHAIDAAILLIAAANRRGEHELAINTIAALIKQAPAAQHDAFVILQTANAQLGLKRPQAALTSLDAAITHLTSAGLGFDAKLLRARALDQIPERVTDGIAAWEHAIAAARNAPESDLARNGLLSTVWRAKQFDRCLTELDKAIATTTHQDWRARWLDQRPNVLAAKGDADGALAALEELSNATADSTRKRELRLRQARVAAEAGRWKAAAAGYDAALAQIAPGEQPADRLRHTIQLEKAQALAVHDIDSVTADLDALDASWSAPGWPLPIDLRVAGLLAAGRADDALNWLSQRLQHAPEIADHPAALQLCAEAELKRGNTEAAMKNYQQAAAIAADEADPRALGAALSGATATQQWRVAAEIHERLMAVDPDSANAPAVRVIAANAQLRLGEFKRALKLTDDIASVAQPFQAMGGLVRGEALFHLSRLDDSLDTATAALEHVPSNAQAVPVELLISLHNLRAQVLNQQKSYEAARDAATKAIDIADPPGTATTGLSMFMRIAARLHRALALFRLDKYREAHRDIDAAITGIEQLRETGFALIAKLMPEFAAFEGAPWLAKGALYDAENRTEEALAAYTRAASIERSGITAVLGRGYALAATGDYAQALSTFEHALRRASSPAERADALAGKGRTLVRLARFEEAIDALQSVLDERLTQRNAKDASDANEPNDDPGVFELLGIAYNALQRTAAANRAFRRAWALTAEQKRSANLARGVTAAELRLGDPKAALDFLDTVPEPIKAERTLLFNRALALDALGSRRKALDCLIRAKKAGLDKAQEELKRLDAPAGLARWTHYWFGVQAGKNRKWWGIALLLVAATGLGAPFFQWWLNDEFAWYLLLVPSAVALMLLALPNLKSLGVDAAGVKLSVEPLTATGRDAAQPVPEGFQVPSLSAPPMNMGVR